MPELQEYEVTLDGIIHTLLLDAKDAERYGDRAKKVSPANKIATPVNK